MLCFRFISALVILGLTVAGGAAVSTLAADAPPVAAQPKMAATAAKEPRGRLPNFYSQVVSEKQKEEIYSIQSEYEAKLDELVRQVVAIKAERDAMIEQTLTPEQQKEIAQLRAESEQRRAERRASAAKTKDAK